MDFRKHYYATYWLIFKIEWFRFPGVDSIVYDLGSELIVALAGQERNVFKFRGQKKRYRILDTVSIYAQKLTIVFPFV